MVNIPPQLSQPAHSAAPILRYEQWLRPDTSEQVSLYFDGQQTQVKCGGVQTVVRRKPVDLAAVQAQMQMLNETMTRWDVMVVPRWRRRWIEAHGSAEQAKRAFVAAGFPAKLWEDINAFQRALGLPTGEDNQAAGVSSFAGTLGANGIITVVGGTKHTIDLHSPIWKSNLLVNPTPEIRQLYARLNTIPALPLTPPTPQAQAEDALHEQSRMFAQQGFIRISPRRPDGTLWLPPALEAHRAQVLKLERPVVRPYVKAGKPALWDSKFGGVPYRPKGTAWPMTTSGKPLSFLAQIDLGEANRNGVLTDLPRHGLLQFFLDDTEAKVIYWPQIVHDEAALTHEIPHFDDTYQDEMFNPPEHAMGFVTDTEIPSSLDTLMQFAEPKNAHTGIGEDYQQAEYSTKVQPSGHRLRGYPMVINTYLNPTENWQLLFQFDGDDYGGQVFGGNALGGWLGFFVRGSDLQKLDFSKVRLEMDAF